MNVLRNIGAVLAGIIVGSIVNMAIVMLSIFVFPLPEGTDLFDPVAMEQVIASFGPGQFLFAFAAHALGTLVGAVVAARIATTRKMWFAIGIGLYFLYGGVTMIAMYGGPMWFKVLDLVGGYIPMGWLGAKLTGGGGGSQVGEILSPELQTTEVS